MVEVSLRLEKGEGVRVFGPARVRVARGLVSVLGAELGEGEEVNIDRYRSYYVKSLGSSEIEASIGGEGRIEAPSRGEEPYDEWLSIADMVISSCPSRCRVAVVGPPESGKTSFTALLANRSLVRGLPTGVVDSDIGQADVGPPGFVSLAMPDSWVTWLRGLDPVDMRFVGSIEPSHVAGRVISATSSLSMEAEEEGAAMVFIDTDGWVTGLSALEYKADIVRGARADWVVVMGDRSLYTAMRAMLPSRVAYAEKPRSRATRTTEDRRHLRSLNYRRFLEGPEREIDLARVPTNSLCLRGLIEADSDLANRVKSVVGVQPLGVSTYPGGVCIIVESRSDLSGQSLQQIQKSLQANEVIIVARDGMRGTLCSLESPQSREYPALLLDIDPSGALGVFKTRYEGEVSRVVFGRIRLSDDYREISRGRILV